jgi:hypothetical protein
MQICVDCIHGLLPSPLLFIIYPVCWLYILWVWNLLGRIYARLKAIKKVSRLLNFAIYENLIPGFQEVQRRQSRGLIRCCNITISGVATSLYQVLQHYYTVS